MGPEEESWEQLSGTVTKKLSLATGWPCLLRLVRNKESGLR